MSYRCLNQAGRSKRNTVKYGFSQSLLAQQSSSCDLAFREALDLYDREQYLLSSILFRQLRFFDCESDLKIRADYGLMLGMYQLGEAEEVTQILAHSRLSSRKFSLFEAVFITQNSQGLADDEKFRFQLWKARKKPEDAIKIIQNGNLVAQEKDRLEQYILNLHAAQKYSVATAATLSIVPGLGQVYVGAWSSAFVSLVVNGIFGWATYEFYDHKHYAAGTASAFVTSITYFGNIVQAGRLAHAKNERLSQAPEAELNAALFGNLWRP